MKLGFIGAGNMGSAIIGGIINSEIFPVKNIIACDLDGDILHNLQQKLGINVTQSNKDAVAQSDIIFICVKPIYFNDVVLQIKEAVTGEKIIISIMAGKTLEQLYSAFEETSPKIIRAMPNTPALIGRGITAICHYPNINQKDIDIICKIFAGVGEVKILAESLFDAFIGVAGSSPAYAFMLIEAMADAGVANGLSRSDAIKFSAQAIAGAAEMVLATGNHPAALKDAVASPAGTTIAAIAELEAQGFRNAVIQAINACVAKSIQMNFGDN